MMILTKAIEKKLIAAGEKARETGESAEKAALKLFDPCGRFTLYVFDAERTEDGDYILYGYAISALGPDCDEWGYSSLNELKSSRNSFGLGIERDRYFDGITREEIKAGVQS